MNNETIMWAIGMLGGLIGIYVRMETKMKELDVRVKGLEKTDNAMNEKLDRLLEMINDIRVKIAKND
jgi:chaperonin cofactor prefoldin